MKTKTPYLMIEEPDSKGTIDYMGKYPVQIKTTLTGNELHVFIMAAEYPNEILEDKCYIIPKGE